MKQKGAGCLNNVNASSDDILHAMQTIRLAIQSIEKTQNSITRKYQQLGEGWKDRKYQELGYVIQDCVKSLNSILKTLKIGDKYITQLAQSVSDYEAVSITGGQEGDMGFVQRLRNMAGASDFSSYQYCLGVLTKGTLASDYVAVLEQRRDASNSTICKVFNTFSNKLNIRSSDLPSSETPHYSPMNIPGHPRGVYYNANADMDNPRGAGSTFFHELGHMIDHAATDFQGNLSNTAEFENALREDGNRLLSLYNNLSADSRNSFLTRIRQDSAHSFSDLIDATTHGQLRGAYGHSRGYWDRPGNLQAEAFAHFFEASMGGGDKLEMLANFFPTAFGVFSDLIDSIHTNVLECTLER